MSNYKLSEAAQALVSQRPEIFQKLAMEFMANQFPSLSAAFDAYQASRAEQEGLRAQQHAAQFPALHATQPAMMAAQQQMMYGMGDMQQQQPVHHHRRHRHHS